MYPIKKFKLFPNRKHKITPLKESLSLEDLTLLVRRLSVQMEEIETQQKVQAEKQTNQILIDPYAAYVSQDYHSLLRRLEELEQCAAVTVRPAETVPWIKEDVDPQYMYWCTLLRCLPFMDSMTSTYVKTIALFAMQNILLLQTDTISHNTTEIPPEPLIEPSPTLPSPLLSQSRFHRWTRYKKRHQKMPLTDTNTPRHESPKRIGSWFF